MLNKHFIFQVRDLYLSMPFWRASYNIKFQL